jgi:hypothetical protein
MKRKRYPSRDREDAARKSPHYDYRRRYYDFVRPSEEALLEREKREPHSTLTGLLMGDPIPGRSALDVRKLRLV